MKVVAVIVLIAVLAVLIAPVVHLCPAARLVRAGYVLQSILVFLPLNLARAIAPVGRLQCRGLGSTSGESLPAFPIFTRDSVLLC